MNGARGQETADGRRWPFGAAEERPPSLGTVAPCKRGAREDRQGRRNDTARVEDDPPGGDVDAGSVRRRHPTGASPSRRSAPGRTLSPMPSEQKGAYGGHLAFFWRSTEESLHMNGPENRPPDAPRVEPRSRPTWCSSLHAEPSRLGPFP